MTLPGFEPPQPPEKNGYSARLTRRRERHLEKGVNPGTGLPFREEGSYTCGDCWHALHGGHGRNTYWKCEMGKLSHSATSDIRLKWPACVLFTTKDDGKSEVPAWVTRASERRR